MSFDVNKPLSQSLRDIRNLLNVKRSSEMTYLKLYEKRMSQINYLTMQHGRNVDLFNLKHLIHKLLLPLKPLPRNLIIETIEERIRILTGTKNRETSPMADNKPARVLLRFYTWQIGGAS